MIESPKDDAIIWNDITQAIIYRYNRSHLHSHVCYNGFSLNPRSSILSFQQFNSYQSISTENYFTIGHLKTPLASYIIAQNELFPSTATASPLISLLFDVKYECS